MRNAARWWRVAIASVGVLALVGCSQKKNEAAAPPVGEPAGTAAPADTEATEHESGGPGVTPAGTVAEIWVQVETEQSKLASAIENGRLRDVDQLAFGIRDLVVALADKANVETPAVAQRLNPMVDLVKESTSRLDELGNAGDLRGTQTELAKLNAILAGMKAATTRA
jgi:hypothetical protein